MYERQAEFGYRRFAVCLLIGIGIAGAVYSAFWLRPWESAVERAQRLCSQCGLVADEIDRLIDTRRHSTLTRDENL